MSGLKMSEIADELHVSLATIYLAISKDDFFSNLVKKAQVIAVRADMEKCVDLADSATPEDVAVQKLRIWARQWRAARLDPRNWGEKIEQNTTITLEAGDSIAQLMATTRGEQRQVIDVTPGPVELTEQPKLESGDEL